MIILCGGMVRSGSTWSFNVCRSLLKTANLPYISGYFGEEEQVDRAIREATIDLSQSLIIKAHVPGPQSLSMIREGTVKNIFTFRDPRDIICSRMKFENRGFESVLEVTVQNCSIYNWYRQFTPTLFIRFESMMADPISEIQRISNFLNLDLDDRTCRNIAEENSLEQSKKIIEKLNSLPEDRVFFEASRTIDRDTLLQTDHVNGAIVGRWIDELNGQQQLLAHLSFKPWLIDLDYETEKSWSQLLLDLMQQTNWQHQAQAYWYRGDYHSAASLYEAALELEPDVLSHYWHLGLMLLLQGEENDAQATWLSALLEAEPDNAEEWTAELVQVLETEANRQQDLEEHRVVWVLRQHIREIAPDNLENVGLLIEKSVELDIVEDLEVVLAGAIDLLQNEKTPNLEFWRNLLQNVLDVVPDLPVVAEFTQVCVDRFPGDRSLEHFIIHKTNQLLQEPFVSKTNVTRYLEICHQLQPDTIPILVNLINLYQDTQRYGESLELTDRFLSQSQTLLDRIAGHYLKIRGLLNTGGNSQEAKRYHKTYETLLQELMNSAIAPDFKIDENHIFNLISTISFFSYLYDRPNPANLFKQQFSEFWQSAIRKHLPSLQFDIANRDESRLKGDRILKIGYISGCLNRHSVGSISRWIWQHGDRDGFQSYAYSLKRTEDSIQQQIRTAVSVYHDLSQGQTIPEIAELIDRDEIDILVDLDSLTSSTGCAVMALKPAPIQVTWLGFDASEIPAIDYFIADPYVLPETAQDYYSETIWRLPQTYIAVDGFEVGVPTLRREQLEIPTDAVVYFSSQTGAKRHPDNVRLQMRILKDVPNSYFLVKGLYTDIESVKRFFQEIAAEEGVNFEQLRFLPDVPSEAVHRANLAIADVVLDTYPYNGTTTTLETLWMGIPVVTRVGQQFASRQGYTLLMNVGVTEGIAWTDEDYVEWGIRLGKDSRLRQDVAWKLRRSRQNAPLWNAEKFTRDLEDAYRQMWELYRKSHE